LKIKNVHLKFLDKTSDLKRSWDIEQKTSVNFHAL